MAQSNFGHNNRTKLDCSCMNGEGPNFGRNGQGPIKFEQGPGYSIGIRFGQGRALLYTIHFGQGSVILFKYLSRLWFGSKIGPLAALPVSHLAVQFFISSSSPNSIQCLQCSLPFSYLRLHQPITTPVSGCINAGMPGFPSSLLDELKSEICSSTSLLMVWAGEMQFESVCIKQPDCLSFHQGSFISITRYTYDLNCINKAINQLNFIKSAPLQMLPCLVTKKNKRKIWNLLVLFLNFMLFHERCSHL